MSFSGVTFANQKATPSDDALLMQTVLRDGILYGCGLEYAGFTLSMGPGQLIACGRNIRHPASESWAITGAASGFARITLNIDLSKAATTEVFDQIDISIDYSSTADGFAALEQSEINVSGSKYQVEICVVSLSAGGITRIVRSMQAATLRTAPDFLRSLLAAGYMQLSPYQIVEELPPVVNLPEGTFLVKLIQKVE